MPTSRLLLRVAYPIIIAGLFIMVAFVSVNRNSFDFNFYLILGVLIVYIFLFGFATGQSFSNPVKRLLEAARSLNNGDLKSRFYLERKDELGELAKVFNIIAQNLEESKFENKNMERAVDMKVQARTQDLKETIDALEQKVKNRSFELQKLEKELKAIKNSTNDKV